MVDARGAIDAKPPEYSGLLSLPQGFGQMLRYPYGMQTSNTTTGLSSSRMPGTNGGVTNEHSRTTTAQDAYVRARARPVFCRRRRYDGGPCIGYANTAFGFEANAAWPWVTGAFLLLASLVIVALHQYWRGAAAITVSVVGWVLALRAAFLMAFPHAFMAAANAAIGVGALWVSVDIFIGFVGLYLTYVGWGPVPSQTVAQAETSTADLPRAA